MIGLLRRGLWLLLGLLVAADFVRVAAQAGSGRMSISPGVACTLMFDAWIVSWIAAMVWSRRTAARPVGRAEAPYLVVVLVGVVLLSFGSMMTHLAPLWTLPAPAGWALAAVCGAGLAFTWWARIVLGSLWSGSVTRKDDHAVVQNGPYRLVRHPIYTGLIAAALADAVIIGQAANLAGALILAVGFWIKARLEERFLSAELGAAAYADYRRRTPMLAPFWPGR